MVLCVTLATRAILVYPLQILGSRTGIHLNRGNRSRQIHGKHGGKDRTNVTEPPWGCCQKFLDHILRPREYCLFCDRIGA